MPPPELDGREILRLATARVLPLIAKKIIRRDDAADLIQELAMYYWKNRKRYKENRKASPRTFAGRCMDMQLKWILHDRLVRPDILLNAMSLHEIIENSEDEHMSNVVTPQSFISTRDCFRMPERQDLLHDVADFVHNLPPRQALVCQRLMQANSIKMIAQEMQITQEAVRAIVRQIKKKMLQAEIAPP